MPCNHMFTFHAIPSAILTAATAPATPPAAAVPVLCVKIMTRCSPSQWHKRPSLRAGNLPPFCQPLNVLSRAVAPLATTAALIHLLHVHLNTATKVGDVGLLKFMMRWSWQPGGRPLNNTPTLAIAMQVGNLDVLDWWIDESG
ncbi:hypothetical protein BCR44DRAFT_1070393 [Catenaria anguillulae PL171]|uniref:Ankyrin repeat-containing domain protein n=1 Tax=Catenaria anguillulae PL171 TaxID=765915 RepID=A0A1Y2H927_9FUNG|nr:hypothetical protein BCR44DRAFT_1070393 [Catenaria anguillulae PL171]